jgi:hypothetical protein
VLSTTVSHYPSSPLRYWLIEPSTDHDPRAFELPQEIVGCSDRRTGLNAHIVGVHLWSVRDALWGWKLTSNSSVKVHVEPSKSSKTSDCYWSSASLIRHVWSRGWISSSYYTLSSLLRGFVDYLFVRHESRGHEIELCYCYS